MTDQPLDSLESADLEELADIISKRLNNPITIEDANHRLIAYSKHGDSTDKARMETIMARGVPEAVINRLWQDGIIQKLMESDSPIRIEAKNEVGLGNRVAISIRKGHSVLGYIYVQEFNEPLGEQEMLFLRQAAHVAMPKLHRRQTRKRIQEEKSKEFFWELLLGSLTSHHEIQMRAELVNVKLPRPFTVFIFEMDEENSDQIEKELVFLLSNLRESLILHQFPLWVRNQKYFIIFGGGATKREPFDQCCNMFIQEVCGKIRERFGSLCISGVFGNPYESYHYIEKSYQQALSVMRVKKLLPEETAQIYGYTEMGIYRLLPSLMERNEEEKYVNHRLERLIRYDEENHSNLVSTLETFLDCAGHVNLASSKLHIHPNTLAYRMKRIAEVSGLNLENPNERATIFIDIKLRKLST